MVHITTVMIIIGAYLIGSIPFGFLLAYFWKGIDIRKCGSGNIGATNVWRTLGKVPGMIVLILDMIKGISAVLLAKQLENTDIAVLGVALAVMAGHSWPLWLRFKGGKIIATGAGAILALSPMPLLLAFLVWLTTVVVSRYVSLGSILGAVSLPIWMALLNQNRHYLIFSVLVASFAVWKHSSNIGRLIKGTEFKIGQKKT
ncbi:acyl-phosphate glycerol-3-phosphate acyltransferase [Desulforamulus reducens MI-1]|uniref:Glycerol-3-phosphate acyltransferase n=1 Tax=Desulforamulus reducens (strain ATCC BAA-1160 / DSM 100696 / MI-1) TaxID=349161 RepID=PLSY_DESRM|nr:glycerol-3-phosphate 1-O-acyltransferase PlsY [Desulforamulus reducens]A4J3P2.1 RecName: Full=Glycerol-3-phosphate acyltransferase; AltName: Full=Acyl-PO4 G3P acyltransferase; AltName: Full=Acyl-phosphate--glycerol-3-phosphate acyltransferase; AltName: Full=G3P acyltransferase; Short=GPAT; AltName: Full=Lysophosphatidic acid synthase; Short=LPA synthase [Desulforamulus reducens MI-1]ABO49695.1 acyl-phosphate glycerol-3-phosphate acyltransferase [Desulforamulus reducens MI-1]